jgi:peptidylprolyl isomerase
MTLQKGDFILIDYTAKVKETNEVFDTTNEETSKKERLHKEGEIYEPKLVVIGENWVLKALDESLTTMELGKTQTVEIPPKDAFGQRDPEKIRRVPLKQLTAKGTNPTIGMRIDYNGKTATIRSIGAGRVLLDFNPPLAGKTLVYDVTVNKKLETNEEKITALIHRRIPLAEPETFRFAIKGKTTLTIDMPETAFYIEGIQIAKRGIAMDVQRFLPELTEIRFVETFKSEPKPEIKPKPEPEPKPEAPTEEPKPKPKPKKKPTTKQKPEKSKPKQEPKPETES